MKLLDLVASEEKFSMLPFCSDKLGNLAFLFTIYFISSHFNPKQFTKCAFNPEESNSIEGCSVDE